MEQEKEEKEKELPSFYKVILSSIPVGSANPITVSQLSKITGYSGNSIRNAVHELRVTYLKPIGSSILRGNAGYFIAVKKDELNGTIAHFNSRRRKMYEVVRAFKSIPDDDQLMLDI